jgi:hypothetical protein
MIEKFQSAEKAYYAFHWLPYLVSGERHGKKFEHTPFPKGLADVKERMNSSVICTWA